MANILKLKKTKSKIPKTPREKKMFERSEGIAAKESGGRSEKTVPYDLVTTIYKKAKAANKIPKKSDITKAKFNKKVSKYPTDASKKKKK